MPVPINQFKQRLSSDTVQIGCWASFADPYATEVLATAGFDWILLDGEHAPNDIRSLLAQLQVLAGFDVSPVVRIPIGDEVFIKQILDVGAQTLLVPMVESAEQARDLVAATRYAPKGRRGMGGALARASQFNKITDYVQTADDQMCLLIQIETRAGLDALDDILKVDGIDGIFIGPADLSADMGYPGQPNHPEVQQTIDATFKRLKEAGKPAGIVSFDDAQTQRYIDMGVEFTAVGADIFTLAQHIRALADKFRQSPSG